MFGTTNGHPGLSRVLYNPTEAGRLADGVAANPSTSKLTSFNSPSATRVNTTALGAYFDPNPPFQGTSGVAISKQVEVGYNGRSHLIHIQTTFVVPSEDGGLYDIQFQPPIIFTNPNLLTSPGYYEPSNNGMYPLYLWSPKDSSHPDIYERALPNKPVFMMGGNGANTIAIYTKQVSGTALTSFNGVHGNTGGTGNPSYNPGGSDNWGSLGFDFNQTVAQGSTISGTFVFDSYISVGNSTDVQADLAYLHTNGGVY